MSGETLPSSVLQTLSDDLLNGIDRLDTQAEDLDMGGYKIVSLGTPTVGTDAATKTYVDSTLGSLPAQTANLSMGGFKITNMGAPTSDADAATKSYVDNYAQGVQWLDSVKCKTASALSGSPTYDNGTDGVGATLTASSGALGDVGGYTVQLNDRILVDSQSNAIHNGVYVATQITSPYVLTRSTDLDGSPVRETKIGTGVFVSNGTYANNRYIIGTLQSELSDPPNVTVGTDNMTWIQNGGAVSSTQLDAITAAGTLAENFIYIGDAVSGDVTTRSFPIVELRTLKPAGTSGAGECAVSMHDENGSNIAASTYNHDTAYVNRTHSFGSQSSTTITMNRNCILHGSATITVNRVLSNTYMRPIELRLYKATGPTLAAVFSAVSYVDTTATIWYLSIPISTELVSGESYYFTLTNISSAINIGNTITASRIFITSL